MLPLCRRPHVFLAGWEWWPKKTSSSKPFNFFLHLCQESQFSRSGKVVPQKVGSWPKTRHLRQIDGIQATSEFERVCPTVQKHRICLRFTLPCSNSSHRMQKCRRNTRKTSEATKLSKNICFFVCGCHLSGPSDWSTKISKGCFLGAFLDFVGQKIKSHQFLTFLILMLPLCRRPHGFLAGWEWWPKKTSFLKTAQCPRK